jgi:hypothetical protein
MIIQFISAFLITLQLIDGVMIWHRLLTGGKKSKIGVYFSFFVWNISIIFFFFSGTPFYNTILHIINSAFSYHSLSKIRVLKILDAEQIEDSEHGFYEISEINQKIPEQFRIDTSDYKSCRLFLITIEDSGPFGLTRVKREIKMPVYSKNGNYDDLPELIIGQKMNIFL